jgi:arylsulfotransferase ASST
MRKVVAFVLFAVCVCFASSVAFAQTPATMISPTNGSTFTSSSVTFSWTTGTGVTEYWLWVGTAPGTYNIYDANEFLNTSVTVSGIPTNGKTIYVRLFSWINGAWQYNDYTYTEELIASPAAMTSPTTGSVLAGASQSFSWTTGTNVTEYWLWIGSAPGTYNYYDANQGLNTSVTVSGLPTDGSAVYVRLFSWINGAWQYNDYSYIAYSDAFKAAMTSPTPSTMLPGASVTFNWSAGTHVTEYWLWIGSSPGSYNYYDANQGMNTSVTVSGLPTGFGTIYLRLFSYIGGVFHYTDYSYTMYSAPAAMTGPTPGTELPGTTTTFTWNTGVDVTEYWLWVGSAPGTYNYYDANQGLNTSVAVSNLPQDGSAVYVRLLSWMNGAWQWNDYVYKASLPSSPVVSVLQTNNPLVAQYQIIVPKDGQVWVDFGQSSYNLSTNRVPAPAGGGVVNILVAGMQPNATYHLLGNIAYSDGSGWQDVDRTFTTPPLDASLIPGITIAQPNPLLTPSPGIELVNGIRPTAGQIQDFATDLNGNIIWYYAQLPSGGLVNPIKLLPNGHFMMIIGGNTNNLLREIDLAGNTVHDFGVSNLQSAMNAAGYGYYTVNSMHHDFLRLANGHTLVIINRNKTVNGVTLLGDAIVDLDPNYNVVWLWDTFDHLDTSRFPYGYTPTSDWTHSNALYYDPVDGSLLLSSRHQAWVMKIDYNNGTGTGNILWRLGWGGDFTIAGGNTADWQYGQHNPSIISHNGNAITLSVFDDGNFRITSGVQCDGTTIACYSRNVIFDLDTSTMTATDSWYYEPGFFSQATGSSQLLDNGDMEAAFAFIYGQPNTAQIIEVTHTMPAQVVWQLSLSGETTYRSTRMGSLYPGVQW